MTARLPLGRRAAIRGVVLAGALVLVGGRTGVAAEAPLTLIVAQEAGTQPDILARLLSTFLERRLGCPVEVVNRPGAGGEVGFSALARAPADGRTIGFISAPSVVAIPIERPARFALGDFDPLVGLVEDPVVWVVAVDSPFTALADAVTAAKSSEGVMVGTVGVGSDDHLAVLMARRQTGATFQAMPFSNFRAFQKALQTRKVPVGVQALSDTLRSPEAVRALGVMSQERMPNAPEIKSFGEQGVAVTLATLHGVAAPKGLSPDTRARLVQAITDAATDPEFRAKVATKDSALPLRMLGSDAFMAELARLDTNLRALWRDTPWMR